ncbi:MAG: hypothetical protein J6M18_02715 [Actinomycetaceae bacterium]|nr:hypothetical protein [Actinomycetaceae bacterium]
MNTYVQPSMQSNYDVELVENEVPVFVAAAGWALLIFGGSWAYCTAMCGWRNVRSCSTSWRSIKAVCK